MANNNDMKLVDVNCGRLVPQGNLNPNQPGSFAALRNELDKKYASSKCFQASTSYGFQPGYTTKGLNDVKWGHATF
jgi:hypothetical protein